MTDVLDIRCPKDGAELRVVDETRGFPIKAYRCAKCGENYFDGRRVHSTSKTGLVAIDVVGGSRLAMPDVLDVACRFDRGELRIVGETRSFALKTYRCTKCGEHFYDNRKQRPVTVAGETYVRLDGRNVRVHRAVLTGGN